MRRSLFFAGLLLAVPCAASLQAQPVVWPDEGVRFWAPRPTEAAITANDLRTRLYQFADDSMMGREPGTRYDKMATDWIAAEFKRLGLEPAGENGTYFQTIGYGSMAYAQDAVRMSVAGKTLAAGVDWAPIAPNAGTQITGTGSLSQLPTVFGGTYGSSPAMTSAMARGKVVVFIAPPQGNGGPGFRGQPTGNVTAAQEAGAVAILLVRPSVPASSFSETRAVLPTVPGNTSGAVITPQVAATLFGGKAIDQVAVGTAGSPVSGSWEYVLTPMEYPVRNVLAVLPGGDEKVKGQYIVIGAHSDHVGVVRGTPPEHDSMRAFNTVVRPQGLNDRVAIGSVTDAQWAEVKALLAKARSIRPPRIDSIINGADDDGSGTVIMLEIAEKMAMGPRPSRSILFHSHAAEEKGLLGSAWWTEHPTVPLDSIVAGHNMDIAGKGRVTDVQFGGPHSVQMVGSRRLSPEFGDMIDSLNAVRDEPMVIDYSWDRTNRLNRFCRSDQVSYIRKGIPTTYFSLGYSRDYHQVTDEPQYINYDLVARVGRFVHEVALNVANRPMRLAVLPRDQQDPAARCEG